MFDVLSCLNTKFRRMCFGFILSDPSFKNESVESKMRKHSNAPVANSVRTVILLAKPKSLSKPVLFYFVYRSLDTLSLYMDSVFIILCKLGRIKRCLYVVNILTSKAIPVTIASWHFFHGTAWNLRSIITLCKQLPSLSSRYFTACIFRTNVVFFIHNLFRKTKMRLDLSFNQSPFLFHCLLLTVSYVHFSKTESKFFYRCVSVINL